MQTKRASSSLPTIDQPITPTTRFSFSPQIITVILINQLVGCATFNIGGLFECGIVLGPLITVIVSLMSMYTMFLYARTISVFHLSNPEEALNRIFGRQVSIVVGFLAVFFCFLINIQYFNFLSTSLKRIILHYHSDAPPSILDPFFLNSLFFVIFLIPLIHTVSLKAIFAISLVAIIAVLIMVVTTIYSFAVERTAKTVNNIAFFKFDKNAVFCFTKMTTYFQLYPFNYPGIRHLRHNSVRMWTTVVCRAIAFTTLAYLLIGILEYFRTANIFENSETIELFLEFTSIFVIAASFPALMNPARYTIQNCFLRLTSVDTTMWFFFGYCFQIAALIISSLYNRMVKYIVLLISILSALLSFILPAILYLVTFKTLSIANFVLSIILLLFVVTILVFNILYTFNVKI